MNEKVARKKFGHKNTFLVLNPAAENLIWFLVPVIFKNVFSSYEMAVQVIQ
jgi:hypothetical protein